MFDTMLSLAEREEVGLKYKVGPTTHVEVEEAEKVSEMCARQSCADRTGKLRIVSTQGVTTTEYEGAYCCHMVQLAARVDRRCPKVDRRIEGPGRRNRRKGMAIRAGSRSSSVVLRMWSRGVL
jgi:hypothetical protein